MIWSFLRKHFTQFWRNLFKDMVDTGLLNNADFVHLECLRFCFFPLIQKHLLSFKQAWNLHRIRSQRQRDITSGVPDVLFHQPLVYGTRDYSFRIPCDMSVLEDIKMFYTDANPARGCSEEFVELVELLSGQGGADLLVPTNVREAKQLFTVIMSRIEHNV